MKLDDIEEALKQRVEKSGRRWLVDIWDLELADDSRGQSLVDYYTNDANADVVSELFKDYIRKYDGYGATTPKTTRVTRELASDQRGEALEAIVAAQARRHPMLIAFRREVLKNKLLPDVESIEDWVKRRCKKEGLPDGWERVKPTYSSIPDLEVVSPTVRVEPFASRSDWLQYPIVRQFENGRNYIMEAGAPIKPDGTLGRLKVLVEAWLFPNAWKELYAVAFVLTDREPPVHTGRIIEYENQGFPALSRISMTFLDPRLSPKEVARLYAEARSNFLGNGRQDKPMDEKHLWLAIFGEVNCGGKKKVDWHGLLVKWNTEHQDEKYDEGNNNFSRDVREAWSKVTGKTWKDR